MAEPMKYPDSKTKKIFHNIILFVYLFGLPNFWIEDFNIPKKLTKLFDNITKILNFFIYVFIVLEEAAFFTQDNLTTKQQSDLLLFGISHPILISYRAIMAYYTDLARNVLLELIVDLKKIHNDSEVERQMIKKTKYYTFALIFSCFLSVLMSTIDECIHVLKTEATFNVIITAWPLVEDRSMLACAARIVFYILWWIFVTRVFAAYTFVISLTTCLSHQYKNLQSYFYNLNSIFKNNHLNQIEKEEKYEEAFKIGVKLHRDTLQCTKHTHMVCNGVLSTQIIFNIIMLVILMTQMVNAERTLVKAFATAVTATAVLISTGFFMWNAGDVTVEASHLATAMYFSGWENCRDRASGRVRKLVTVAMANAQKPVILKGLSVIDLSYQSFLSIVKTSYSMFSVLY